MLPNNIPDNKEPPPGRQSRVLKAPPYGPIHVHSVHEARLFLRVSPCGACGTGPIEPGDKEDLSKLKTPWIVKCSACGYRFSILFVRTAGTFPDTTPTGFPIINATEIPSKVIDLNQWLALFHLLRDQAGETGDKHESRQIGSLASLCLGEGLKFFSDDPAEQIPPESAFFNEVSLRRFREHPAGFSRDRLEDLRRRMPSFKSVGENKKNAETLKH